MGAQGERRPECGQQADHLERETAPHLRHECESQQGEGDGDQPQRSLGAAVEVAAVQWVDSKTRVGSNRLENKTDQYHLLNLSSKASWDALTVSVDITNLLDEYYELPLGGVSIAQFKQDMSQGFNQLAGQGRSINLAMSYAF